MGGIIGVVGSAGSGHIPPATHAVGAGEFHHQRIVAADGIHQQPHLDVGGERSVPLFIIPGPDDRRRALGAIHGRHLVNHGSSIPTGILHVGTVPIHAEAAAGVRNGKGKEVIPVLLRGPRIRGNWPGPGGLHPAVPIAGQGVQ